MQSQQNKYWGSDCRNLFQVFPKLTSDKINFCHSGTLKLSINDDSKQFCNKATIHNLHGKKKRQINRKKGLYNSSFLKKSGQCCKCVNSTPSGSGLSHFYPRSLLNFVCCTCSQARNQINLELKTSAHY